MVTNGIFDNQLLWQNSNMKFNYKLFSATITDQFKYKDSLRKIAPKIGISTSTLHRAIKCKTLEIDTILSICEWLGTDIQFFIEGGCTD